MGDRHRDCYKTRAWLPRLESRLEVRTAARPEKISLGEMRTSCAVYPLGIVSGGFPLLKG
jgi:hypothetical protein